MSVADYPEDIDLGPGPTSAPLPTGKLPNYYRTLPSGEIKELTKTEYKDAMRKEFTLRRPRPTCGHRFAPGAEPQHRNCEACWFAFFQTHGELTQACDEVFANYGEAGLRQLRGPKFTKNYLKFMATLAHLKQMMEAQNGERISGAGESGGGEIEPSAGAGSSEDSNQAAE